LKCLIANFDLVLIGKYIIQTCTGKNKTALP